jgi:hypothetical protein
MIGATGDPRMGHARRDGETEASVASVVARRVAGVVLPVIRLAAVDRGSWAGGSAIDARTRDGVEAGGTRGRRSRTGTVRTASRVFLGLDAESVFVQGALGRRRRRRK